MTMYDPILDLDIPNYKEDWRWEEGYKTGFETGVQEGFNQAKKTPTVTNDDRINLLLELIKYKCDEKFYNAVLIELEKLNDK